MPQKSLSHQKRKQPQAHNAPKPTSAPTTSSTTPDQTISPIAPPLPLPTPVQHLILRLYAHAFPTLSADPVRLHETIQSVKSSLYQRDFVGAFEGEEKREAYALRWSVTRAAGYAAVLRWYGRELGLGSAGEEADGEKSGQEDGEEKVVRGLVGMKVDEVVEEERVVRGDDTLSGEEVVGESVPNGLQRADKEVWKADSKGKKTQSLTKAVCLGGGGGAELIALALASSTPIEVSESMASSSPQSGIRTKGRGGGRSGLDVTIVDSADWRAVTDQLYRSFLDLAQSENDTEERPPHDTRSPNNNIISSNPFVRPPSFLHLDLLHDLDTTKTKSLFSDADLVTICFTLNELCSASMSRMTRLLLEMTDCVAKGARLCVVDSPGSYATVKLGKGGKEKAYPMGWLLDWVLMDVAASSSSSSSRVGPVCGKAEGAGGEGEQKESQVRKWEKLVGEESSWFRWAKHETLRYGAGLKLEDMRFQVHIYRRL